MRTTEQAMEVAKAIANLTEALEGAGFTMRSGHNFRTYEALIRRADRQLTEHFMLSHHTLTPEQGFWLVLLDRNGTPVGTVAARLDLLGTMTLADYLREYLPRIYRAHEGKAVTLSARQTRFWNEVRGRVAYLGEMWVAEPQRRRGLASQLGRLVQLIALLQFDPDYVYCWMWGHNARAGFAEACGFAETIQRGVRWDLPPAAPQDFKDLWLAGNCRASLFELAYNVNEDACLMVFPTLVRGPSQCRPLYMASTGGGGIVIGLVVSDRFRV